MKAHLLKTGGSLLSLMVAMTSIQASAGESTVFSKTEVIEITNPARAFNCRLGDGGFVFTTVALDPDSIPSEFGSNFRQTDGISASFPNRNGNATPCEDARKAIDEEIRKQGGRLHVSASRSLSRLAYPDKGCSLYLAENIEITIGSLHLSGVTTFFITELPISSHVECKNLVPGKI